MGVYAAMRIVGPPLHAGLADRPGRRLPVMRWSACAGLLCLLALQWADGLLATALLLALLSSAWNGLMPIYDAQALDQVRGDAGRYAALRLWGSLGFIAAALAGGAWLEQAGAGRLPLAMAALAALTWAGLLLLRPPPRSVGPAAAPVALLPHLRDRRVQLLLAVAFLMVLSHGPYYNFFSLYLEAYGHTRTAIGVYWAWAVAAEVGVFVAAGWLTRRYSLRTLLVASLAATLLRWCLIAAAPASVALVVLAQTLHLASFGLFHLSTVTLVALLFPPAAAARAQALLGSIGYGLGGMLGAIGSGWLWEAQGPRAPYVAAALVVALALALVARSSAELPGRGPAGPPEARPGPA